MYTITDRVCRGPSLREMGILKKLFQVYTYLSVYSFQHNRLYAAATLNYQPYYNSNKGDKIMLQRSSNRNFSFLRAARKKLANQIKQSCGNSDPHFAEKNANWRNCLSKGNSDRAPSRIEVKYLRTQMYMTTAGMRQLGQVYQFKNNIF